MRVALAVPEVDQLVLNGTFRSGAPLSRPWGAEGGLRQRRRSPRSRYLRAPRRRRFGDRLVQSVEQLADALVSLGRAPRFPTRLTCGYHSTSGSNSSPAFASRSPAVSRPRSRACTSSTFSCDIAYSSSPAASRARPLVTEVLPTWRAVAEGRRPEILLDCDSAPLSPSIRAIQAITRRPRLSVPRSDGELVQSLGPSGSGTRRGAIATDNEAVHEVGGVGKDKPGEALDKTASLSPRSRAA